MLRCREDGPVLTVVYRPRPLAIAGAALLVAGIALFVVGATKPHEVRLRCRGADCTMERVAILGGERVVVANLRGARTTPEELVLEADPEVVMGPWVARRGVPSYRAAEQTIDAYVAGGRRGALVTSVPVRGTVRWIGFAAVAFVLGIAVLAVFAIGARAVLDRSRDEVRRFGSRARAKVTDITAVDVKGNQIVATLRAGRPIALVSALGAGGDLETAAAKIRAFLEM